MVIVKLEDDNEVANDGEKNCLLTVEPLPDDMRIIKPPDDWVPKPPNKKKGEPHFEDVDNPGGWHQYTFTPRFHKESGKYIHHRLPTGATPVPAGRDSKRVVNGWEFHYNEWKLEDAPYRNGATKTNPFPTKRKGRLDYQLLKRLGLTKSRILKNDCLFFLQLVLPFCNTDKSGIEDDPRISFYSDIKRFTQKYAASLGIGGSYGHNVDHIKIQELVRYDMCVVMDGVLGGSQGAMRSKMGSQTRRSTVKT